MQFDNIENSGELKLYLDSPFTYKASITTFYHYTKLDSLAEIFHGSSLRFSPLEIMNDKIEDEQFGKFCDKKFFCLMASKTDSFGMWAMYGGITKKRKDIEANPGEINVKICFPTQTVKNLCQQGVTPRLVAYADFAGVYKDSTPLGEEEYFYRCGTKKTKGSFKCDKQKFAGYLKDLAWRYESELRLCCDKNNPNDNAAVNKPFNSDFLKDLKVIPSPLISKIECEKKFREVLKKKNYKLDIDISQLFESNFYADRIRIKE